MKKVFLFLMAVPLFASGQVNENFESGVIINWIEGSEGHWKADTLQSITGQYSLHHIFDNASAGNDCIGFPISNLHPSESLTRWSFRLRHSYDPSSSNSWAAYLMSDHDPCSFANGSGVSGYAVGVNLSGYDDSLRIWKIRKGASSVLTTCPVNWQADIGMNRDAEIIVERTADGKWTISAFTPGNILKGTSSCQDNELFTMSWFMLNYRYSSTRDRLLWFDDFMIEGFFYDDTTPPVITECQITGKSSLNIVLNEEPSDGIFILSNYFLKDDSNKPSGVEKKSPLLYRLFFQNEFINKKQNSLVIIKLCDKNGNCADSATVSFTPAWAETGDVIISEIMADPLPSVSLPPKEYIEITNRSQFPFNLKNWRFSAGDQKVIMPSLTINPDEYIIVCSQTDITSFSEFGKTMGVKAFPDLTDGAKLLVLSDSLGDLIHGVEYSSEWYDDVLKSGGGWSLEMIDTRFPFFAEGNWEVSGSGKGGTPGKTNSGTRTNPDIYFKGILNAFPLKDNSVRICFSEPIPDFTEKRDNILVESNKVSSVSSADPLMRFFEVIFTEPLTIGKIYSLSIIGDITDFAGNRPGRDTYRFGVPEPAMKNDIVFNELLFNPYPDDPDYLEFTNCSEKIIDASGLFLTSVNTETGDTSEVKPLSEEKRCILPGSYYVATTDCKKVTERYIVSDPEAIFISALLPSMPDDKGHLLLLNREMELVDEVVYTEKMHYPLLSGYDGVSLEKIRPGLRSDESTSWHSASESSGWGTPGKENSVYQNEVVTDDRIILSSGRISPDNDGYEDILVIDLNLDGIDNVVSVTIFDETGSYIRKICENLLAGNRASLVWDGAAEDSSLVRQGIYIIYIEIYDDKGKTKSWKKVCSVVR